MNGKAAKQIRKASRETRKELSGEIREQFIQDFGFFRSTICGWPLLKRLMFCRDLILKRV